MRVTGHRVLATGEPNVWQTESNCSQDTTQFFHCLPKQTFHVSKVLGPDYSGTLTLFPVKWNCPTHPGTPWARKLLSFREALKVKFGGFYEIFVFLSKSKYVYCTDTIGHFLKLQQFYLNSNPRNVYSPSDPYKLTSSSYDFVICKKKK